MIIYPSHDTYYVLHGIFPVIPLLSFATSVSGKIFYLICNTFLPICLPDFRTMPIPLLFLFLPRIQSMTPDKIQPYRSRVSP